MQLHEERTETISEELLTGIDPHRLHLLAFVADKSSLASLRSACGEAVPRLTLKRGTIAHAIRHLEREPTPHALVIDISGIANPVGKLDELASVCAPDVKVLVVGDNPDITFYRDITRNLGVTEYLAKPLTRDSVAQYFLPHVLGTDPGPTAQRGGAVTVVCGARGGVGATTIAVHLARALASDAKGHVALLDMHLQKGSTALMLGVKAGSGLRVALEDPDHVDSLFLDRAAVPIGDRLRLIAAEEPFSILPHVSMEGTQRLFALLRQRFSHLVVNMPIPTSEAEQEIFVQARHRIVVTTPDVAGMRDADRVRELVFSLTGSKQISIVLNRHDCAGALSRNLISEALHGETAIRIPTLDKPLRHAANLGKPDRADIASFRKPLLALTQEVSGRPMLRTSRGIFGRIFGR